MRNERESRATPRTCCGGAPGTARAVRVRPKRGVGGKGGGHVMQREEEGSAEEEQAVESALCDEPRRWMTQWNGATYKTAPPSMSCA